jgi:hypothetical protein
VLLFVYEKTEFLDKIGGFIVYFGKSHAWIVIAIALAGCKSRYLDTGNETAAVTPSGAKPETSLVCEPHGAVSITKTNGADTRDAKFENLGNSILSLAEAKVERNKEPARPVENTLFYASPSDPKDRPVLVVSHNFANGGIENANIDYRPDARTAAMTSFTNCAGKVDPDRQWGYLCKGELVGSALGKTGKSARIFVTFASKTMAQVIVNETDIELWTNLTKVPGLDAVRYQRSGNTEFSLGIKPNPDKPTILFKHTAPGFAGSVDPWTCRHEETPQNPLDVRD